MRGNIRIHLITSGDHVVFIYADAVSADRNYHPDDVEYGLDATEHLLKSYDLIRPLNSRIEVRKGSSGVIEYVPFDFKPDWNHVSDVIRCHLGLLKVE